MIYSTKDKNDELYFELCINHNNTEDIDIFIYDERDYIIEINVTPELEKTTDFYKGNNRFFATIEITREREWYLDGFVSGGLIISDYTTIERLKSGEIPTISRSNSLSRNHYYELSWP